MACQSSADKELADMSECCICTDIFQDPRMLPCTHTFCMACLLNYGKDRQPGDRMPCPLCRTEFIIPDEGLITIPKNFFMDRVINVRKLSAKQGESVKDDCHRRVLWDKYKLSEKLKISEELLQHLAKDKNDVNKQLAGIEEKVSNAAEELIAAVQRERLNMMSEIKSIKAKREKQLETVKKKVKEHIIDLKTFEKCSEKLLRSGSGDVNTLHHRANELMAFDVRCHVDSFLPPVNVTYTPSTLLDRRDRILLGTIGQLKQISSSTTICITLFTVSKYILELSLINYSLYSNK